MASCGSQTPAGEEPLSPTARMFHGPGVNCCIVAIIGMKTSIDPAVIKAGREQTLVHHSRFSSMVLTEKMRWVPTKVNIDEHVIVPDLNPDMPAADAFVEDYVSYMTREPLEPSRPLWEVHLLNVRTTDAAAVVVFRIHHSVGDGASLISLLLACTRKSSDPQALPTLPAVSSRRANESRPLLQAALAALRLAFNTFVDFAAQAVTSAFLRDIETPIKGRPGVELAPKRFVHRNVSLEDVKMVKKALNTTINDVLFGVTEAGLSQYLNRKYAENTKPEEMRQKTDYLPESMLVRAAVLVNVRPAADIQQALASTMHEKSDCKWGNSIGYALVPLSIALRNDPLDYIRKAKATIDRKKQSLEATCNFTSTQIVVKLFGATAAAALSNRVLSNTTLTFSNVVGPDEEVSFYGHPLAWFAPSVYGHPHALTIHFQSYNNKVTISIAVDPNVISDPHQLCDDLEASLKLIKEATMDGAPKEKAN